MSDARARFGGTVVDVPVPGGFVRTEALGAGPPLLLLHGWTLDRRIWAPQCPLAQRRRLILVDRRGSGQSTAPPDLAREPDDMLAVLDRLGLDQVAVGGLSQGGRVALHLALKAPDRVSKLALMGAPLDGVVGPGDPPPPLEALRAAAAGDRAGLAARLRDHPFLTVHTPEATAILGPIIADYAGRDLLNAPSHLPIDAGALASLPMPITALVGQLDTAHRKLVAQTIAQAAPAGCFLPVEHAGHLLNLDQPAAINAAV